MKSKTKNLIIMLSALIIITFIILISYQVESRSQKLPAVVMTDKIFVSSESDGTILDYDIEPMQAVSQSDVIIHLENRSLIARYTCLLKEKEQYQALIASARSGDRLELELNKLNTDILNNELELKKHLLRSQNIKEELEVTGKIMTCSDQQYAVNERLYNENKLSSDEFEEFSLEYREDNNQYNEMRSDSLYTEMQINTLREILSLQKSKKGIILNNPDLIISETIKDLERINTEIQEAKSEIEHLTIISPINGILTDINYKPGEIIKDGDVIAEIADLSHIWITAYGNSFSRENIRMGNYVKIYCSNGEIVEGTVYSVSPVMEKVKYLTSAYETANTYLKIDISLDDPDIALDNLTPGERLFARVYLDK